MKTIILYLLTVWGLTHILVSGSVFNKFRNWCHIKIPFIGKMLDCYQCTGFWVSLFLYFIFDGIDLNIKSNLKFLEPFIWGLIGSGVISYFSILFSFIIKLIKSEK